MTSTLSEPTVVPAPAPARRDLRPWSLAALLIATAALYLWDLGSSGWANQFYAAAVQAGSTSWKAMLFGSSDAANAITVDKTPGALWVMDLSARLFGLNSWSLLVPQALEGVASVAVLYATVRRVAGHGAGLLAGAVLAATPVAALMFRYDNPDALLVLLLTVAAYCVLRAVETDSAAWWLPLAGVAVGFGFLAKMMQAFLVLPAFAVVYLLAARAPWRTRLLRSAGAVLAVIVSAGWYLALVALWPADSRPYIGGSQHDSVLELALGYNGLGRITGDETGGLGNTNFDAGWARLLGDQMGGQIAWLLPAAIILGLAGLWVLRRAPRTDTTRAALLLWLGWLAVTGAVFSFASGILHPYYTVALAPAIGGLVGIGAALMWQRRNDIRATTVLSGSLAITALLAWILLRRTPQWQPWLAPTVLAGGVVAAVLLLLVARLPHRIAVVVAGLAVVTGLAAPTAYSLATVATSHGGAIPSAGPAGAGFGHMRPGGTAGRGWNTGGAFGPNGQGGVPGTAGGQGNTGSAAGGQGGVSGTQGGTAGGQSSAAGAQSGTAGGQGGVSSVQGGAAGAQGGTAGAQGSATSAQGGAAGAQGSATSAQGGAAGAQGGAAGAQGGAAGAQGGMGGAPMGGLFGASEPSANVVAALEDNADAYTWVAATTGSNNAATYQLATRSPVMAIGGYNGTDPAPTLAEFESLVAQHKIHYYIDGQVMGGMRGSSSGGSQEAAKISAWVRANYTARTIDGVTVYDLS